MNKEERNRKILPLTKGVGIVLETGEEDRFLLPGDIVEDNENLSPCYWSRKDWRGDKEQARRILTLAWKNEEVRKISWLSEIVEYGLRQFGLMKCPLHDNDTACEECPEISHCQRCDNCGALFMWDGGFGNLCPTCQK